LQLRDIYAERSPAVSIEFFPPKTPQGEETLASRIPAIKKLNPAFCSVTYGASVNTREGTLKWVRRLKEEFGLEVMCHLTCVSQSKDEINGVLGKLRAMGVENIIALRGDPPKGESQWTAHANGYHHASELVAAAKAMGCFSVAVAGFPEYHPEAVSREADLRYLKEKVDAGADAIITQLFFDNEDYFRYVNEARAVGITVPIVPGILPFRTVADLRRFTTLYARSMTGDARVPPALEARLEPIGNDDDGAARLGIEYAAEQCQGLLSRGAPGIHFYCMNESRAVEAILKGLALPHSPDADHNR
jgi:methylenetetrahydrofolate reductase (NADPH)